MADKVTNLIVRAQIDKMAADMLKKEARDIAKEQERIASATASVTPQATKAASALKAMSSSQRTLDALRKTTEANTEEFEQMRKEAIKASEAVSTVGTKKRSLSDQVGNLERPVRDVTGLVGGLGGGSLVGGANIGADILGAVEGIGRMKEALPGLAKELGTSTVALGALGVGIAAVGIAFNIMQDQMEQSAAATQAYLAYEKEYWELRTTGTTEEAQARREELDAQIKSMEARKQEIDFILQQADQTGGVVGTAYDGLQVINAGLGALNKNWGVNAGGMKDLEKEQQQINKDLQSAQLEFNRLGTDLEAGSFAANDMALSEKELAKIREEAANALIGLEQDKAKAQLDEATRSREWTSEQVKNRLIAIDTELAAQEAYQANLQSLFDRGVIDQEAFDKAFNASAATIRTLTREQESLTETVKPLVAQREREAAVIKDTQKMIETATNNAKKRAELEQAYTAETAEVTAKRNLQLVREEEDYSRKRSKSIADFYVGLADFDKEYQGKQADILTEMAEGADSELQDRLKEVADYNKESARLAEDHREKLLKIQRNTARDIRKAAANLDAQAVLDAQQSAEDQIRDENEQYDKEAQQRQEALNDRIQELAKERQEGIQAGQEKLRDLQQQYQQERQQRVSAFYQKLSEEANERNIALARQRQDWINEDTERANHFNAAVTATRSGYGRVNAEVDSGMAQMQGIVASRMKAIAGGQPVTASAINYRATTGNTGVMTSYGGYRAPEYAGGGTPPIGRDVLVGERGPEWARFLSPVQIYPHGTTPPAGGGKSVGPMTFNIYESGNPARTRAEVISVLNEVLN